ncbi:MAG: hypothetical protein HY788_23765 [Deltaproteobacteria bacterium]|nr:hypothetical protein [Deltaproteobacteria bacterium]
MKGVILPVRPTETGERFIRAANRALADSREVFRVLDDRCADVRRGDVFVQGEHSASMCASPGAQARDVPASMLAPLKRGRIAVLWDESFFWGVLAVAGLNRLGFEYQLISCSDVRYEGLCEYDLLVVPGGWAAEKARRLGKTGRHAVRAFVRAGGAYLGFCGGAGLSLDVTGGLGLLPVKRKPSEERVPNFSGSLMVRPESEAHPAWLGLNGPQRLYVWWPSQFEIADENAVRILGRYTAPCDDFFVSDLNVFEILQNGGDWIDWEQRYGANLDPARLEGEPAVLEGRFGEGTVIASYAHLETPGSAAGAVALFNSIQYLLTGTRADVCRSGTAGERMASVSPSERRRIHTLVEKMVDRAEALRTLGVRVGLWEPRNDWFLLWRRGVKGFAFNALFGLINELNRRTLESGPRLPGDVSADEFLAKLGEAAGLSERFFLEASGVLTDIRLTISELPRRDSQELYHRVSRMGGDNEIYRRLQECLGDLLYHLLRVSGE